jgi:5-methyltetrahydropteroyltriglutamate--homocysteine methyltransferase
MLSCAETVVFHFYSGGRMHAHLLGFPRMGAARELKWALERHWRGEVGAKVLCSVADDLKRRHWALQAEAGMTIVPVGDFSLYDHMLDAAVMLGAVPSRFRGSWPSRGPDLDLDGYFRLARGDAERGIAAMEMTKWFDTNYHYIVPEFDASTVFAPDASGLLADLDAVAGMGLMAKAVLPGPLTFLLLAKDASGDPLDRAMALAEAYAVILAQLDGKCVGIQLDEPCLCTDLPDEARRAYVDVYARLRGAVKDSALLLATYFGPLGENLELALSLPVDAVHLDLVRGAGQLEAALERLPGNKALSLGVVDGRNVWRTDLDAALGLLRRAREALGPGRVNVSASCSLLHSPMDVAAETGLDPELRSWMAFAVQKCAEVAALKSALETGAEGPLFVENRAALAAGGRGHAPAAGQRRHQNPGAARPPGAAAPAQHHHRLLPADRRDTLRPPGAAQGGDRPGRIRPAHARAGGARGPAPGGAGARRARAW